MESETGIISKIYKERTNLIEILKERGYDVSDYDDFSINHVAVLYQHDQLDLLLKNKEDKQIFVKHYLDKKSLRGKTIYELLEDLYISGKILNKTDDLLIITLDDPNETITTILNTIWENHEIYISVISIKRLLFNILKHEHVPKHEILSEEDTIKLFEEYNINEPSQLPQISRYDPVAVAIGLRPKQICKITRKSKSAIESYYYRYCI
jgi:DNA-directed RNA polymerase I, II, and III subunit RPABC1